MGRGRTVVLAGVAAFAAIAVAAGCSLIVNQSALQCSVNADCARFAGTQCVQGACQSVAAGFDAAIDPNQPCTSTQDCLTLHGSNWVCRSTRCQALGSDDCGIVIGNYTADDVLLLGAILPIYGAHKSTGLPMERALDFAAEQDFAGGVPFGLGGGLRPVAVVLCDESKDPVRAAEHLVTDVGVPAIVGPAFGDSYLAVAGDAKIAGRVLLMSPYATADLSALTADGGDDRLAWRTAPDCAGEAAAMAGVVSAVLEPEIDAARSLTKLAVSVVWRKDADGTSLHDALLSSLVFNGLPAAHQIDPALFTDVPYADSDTPGEGAATTVTGASPLPDLVVVLGRTEGVSDVIEGIESVWPGSAPPPYYLVSHGLQVEELLGLVTSLPGLRSRILSTSPGDPQTNGALRELIARYEALYSDYPAETFGLPQAFDAYYALAYGLAAVRNTDVVGLDERDGLEKVLLDAGNAAPVTVGPEGIAAAFAAVDAGSSIALAGASGALRFASGTPASNVQVWCIALAAGTNAPAFTQSGIAWSATTATLGGTLAPACLH